MKNTGFITIGVPKMTGSLMLKQLGTRLSFPMVRRCADLLRQNSSTSPIVAPEPPMTIRKFQNASVMMCVIGNPAASAV